MTAHYCDFTGSGEGRSKFLQRTFTLFLGEINV